MATVSTYLSFDGTCEEAFAFYKDVFGTEYDGPIVRKGEAPTAGGGRPIAPEEANDILHIALPIIGGHRIIGGDVSVSQGHVLKRGNDMSVSLECDDEDQLNEIFAALTPGATMTFGPERAFWGSQYSAIQDQFGVNWILVAPIDLSRPRGQA